MKVIPLNTVLLDLTYSKEVCNTLSI